MLKMVDGTGIIGVDMVCPLGGAVSPPQPPNYDKVEMEGVGSLTLPNSLKAPLERLELLGNSVQLTTTGKNIFDESKAVTGRINPDNGELLPETSYISSDYIEVQEGETYFQSGSGDGYYRAFYDMNKKFTSIPTKGVFKFTVPVGSKFLRISGRKERFGDWMIEKGDKATPYEPYTGGKISPSPEYQQEIKSAGQKSKNLFDINYFKDKSNLKTLQCEGFTLLGIICNVKPNTNYTLSANLTEAQYNLNIANKTQRFSLTSSSARTLMSNDDGTLYIGLFNTTTADAVNMDDFMQQYKNIQLEEGNTATCYEAYSDKYLLDVKVTGKNLFDMEKAKDLYNWEECPVMPTYKDFPIYIGKGNKFSLSFHENLKNMKSEIVVAVALVKSSGINKWLYDGGNNFNNAYTETAKEDYIYIRSNKERIHFFTNDIKTLQVEINPVPTEYQPYTEQTLTLTSDRPLTKWDKLVEQGGEYGIMYNSKHMLLNGSEDWVKSSINNTFYLKSFEGLPNSYEIFCDKLKNFRGAVNVIELNCILANKTNLYICIDGITDIGTLKTWLSVNNLEVYYNSKESQFAPLSESEQTQLRNLHSYNGTTNIMVDSGEVPCGIKLTYRKEK